MAIRTSTRVQRRKRNDRGILNMLLLCVTAITVTLLFTRKEDTQVAASEVKPSVVAEFDTVLVPVPVEYVPTGTKISDIKSRQVGYPAHQLPYGALTSLDAYKDAVTIAPLPANLPVFADNLSLEISALNPIIESIPPGMRAITVKVDATSSVEGWAGSGSIVDVLLVENEKTSVIAEKVKILSAERSLTPVNANSSPSVPKTVTLLVTQEQVLSINTAIPLGRIAFALRGTSDSDHWAEKTFSPDELRGKSRITQGVKGSVNGYVSIKGEDQDVSFALAGDKWIPTEAVPDGFFVNRRRNEASRSTTP